MAEKIIHREKKLKEKNVEDDEAEREKQQVEHNYIDFQYLILGEKMKHSFGIVDDHKLFTDEYIAELMIISNENNLEFYMQHSV